MRAWENRADTVVIDEPLYAYYLYRTGRQHPGRDAVLAAQSNDWREVVAALQAPLPAGARIYYQKHMTHHVDASVALDWLAAMRNCFLIRRPRNMLASLLRVVPDAVLEDTGLPQQVRLFEYVCDRLEAVPAVIDSADVLRDPAGMMRALCAATGVDFSDSMLSWPAGQRDSDGVWAPHWYASVEKSTGFEPWRPAEPEVPQDKIDVLAQCEPLYARMAAHSLQPVDGAD